MINNEAELCISNADLTEFLKATLTKKAQLRFCVKGSSMWPFIRDGDTLTVSSVAQGALERGDVVAFINPQTKKLIIHRLLSDDNGFFLAKGDNSFHFNEKILSQDILGRVSKVERKAKRVSFGLGPEARLIAFLSQTQLLQLFFLPLKSLLRFLKGIIK